MKTTIRDVARAAGVSVSAVSMALNGRAGISPITRERVRRIAGELNYVPNYSAQSLVMQDSSCIGLMVPEIQNPFYSAIVDIMTRLAEERGYTLLLGITNNSCEQEARYTRLFLARQVRGVIVVPVLSHRKDASHLQMLREAGVPIVFCTENYRGCDEPVVMCDFERGQYEAARMLIEKGLRDFWFVSTDMDAPFAKLRYAGYARALREAGIALRPERELMLDQPRYEAAYAATDRILADLPEAILCINDIMTLGIIQRITERRLLIPRDVSVVGFDDIMFSALVTPPLTTVRQPIGEICRRVMDLLVRKLEAGDSHGEIGRGETYLIPPELIVRDTTI